MNKKLNILYHTNLSGNPNAGPTYSVPKQIKSQANIDNVLWINNSNIKLKEWEDTKVFHTAQEYNFKSLKDLPEPFNNPDLVIFESFYQMNDIKLSKELIKKKIPYIIIPRGALTNKAQNIKKIKKMIGNFLFFKKFAKNAGAIQFLTQNEKIDSGNKWNRNCFIIPNGINIPLKQKKAFNNNKTIFSFIGRLSIQHKGLDLLITSINECKKELRKDNCIFNIYGPDENGSKKKLNKMIDDYGLNDIVRILGSVNGEEKEKVLLNTDIFVLTSRFEGHPMGLIEALSYGIPCLVSNGSNMREEVEKYDCGWTADNTVESISKALKKILVEKTKISIKSNNTNNIAREYVWTNIAKRSHIELEKLRETKEDEKNSI